MAWRPISIDDVRLTPAEKSALANIQGAEVTGAELLASVVSEFRAAIQSRGGALGDAGTIDDLVRVHALNRARWLWLCEFPQLKLFQTEARSKLNDAAEKMLAAILAGDVTVPAGDGAGPTPGPSFGTRGGRAANDPPLREFTRETQDGT